VPSGNAANASSVGAKTVKGPVPFKTSTRPAACTAATRVPNWPADIAVSTMSFALALTAVKARGRTISKEIVKRFSVLIKNSKLNKLVIFKNIIFKGHWCWVNQRLIRGVLKGGSQKKKTFSRLLLVGVCTLFKNRN